jgi:SAM-dependent methyltransferase
LKAQEYEQAFWHRRAKSIESGTSGDLDWYDWKAGQLDERLARLSPVPLRTGKVLEIGSGPIGIVNALEWGERYAIDPLEHFYSQTPSLIRLRQPGPTYLTGTGESLPFEDASCALVIIENVIDHTYAPGKILDEIFRVLAPAGVLYLLVNVHTRWGAFLHDALAALHIDKGHPYTFTREALRRMLAQHGFTIALEDIETYEHARRMDRRASSLRARVKGYTGLSEFSHAVYCRKQAAPPEA